MLFMLKKIPHLLILIFFISCSGEPNAVNPIPFKPEKKYLQNKTYTYFELIEAYEKLAKQEVFANFKEIGNTDENIPLYAYELNFPNENGKTDLTILVNNGIHPGEPCGIDASLHLISDLQEDFETSKTKFKGIKLVIIPAFNVGGMFNRSGTSRANQLGPEEYGFRGNSKNLDLNRDFIKADAIETRVLQNFIFNLSPDIFIDTHTTNGADYPYVMTLIPSQPDKAGPVLGAAYREWIEPFLFNFLDSAGFKSTYYVNVFGKDPKFGFDEYLETPRYASGFANLFHTISFVSEAHMLKEYPQRVESTYSLIEGVLHLGSTRKEKIKNLRDKALQASLTADYLPIKWNLRRDTAKMLNFEGYTMLVTQSELTGMPRRRFLKEQPYTTEVPYYRYYEITDSVKVPDFYVIPFAYQEVIERIKAVGIDFEVLDKEEIYEVELYRINDFELASRPYEGRVMISKATFSSFSKIHHFPKGSVKIKTNQPAIKYIVESLEPKGKDSFFSWGFFHSVLQQKEWFSDYVFEDLAIEWLKENPEIEADLKQEIANNPDLANNHWGQLYFIYKKSPWYEPTAYVYPVGRIFKQNS
jgi:hypothetical protein